MLGRKIIKLERVDSTNNYIANLLYDDKIENGTVILADEQTNGKGQRGAVWLSKPAENMIFSIYLSSANLSVKDQFVLTQFISVSVVKTLKKIGLKAVIKWPNDVLINHKKIAGILIENQLTGSSISGSIVGIGLNVNQIDFGELQATSLKLETGNHFSIQEFVFSLLNEINFYWKYIENFEYKTLKDLYLEKLWLLNQRAGFKDENGDFEGIIRGVEENGLLQMERNGEIVFYDLKEIRFQQKYH